MNILFNRQTIWAQIRQMDLIKQPKFLRLTLHTKHLSHSRPINHSIVIIPNGTTSNEYNIFWVSCYHLFRKLFICKQIANDIYQLHDYLDQRHLSLILLRFFSSFVFVLFCRKERRNRYFAGKVCFFVVKTTILWCQSWWE